MFEFNYVEGATMFSAWGMWFVVFLEDRSGQDFLVLLFCQLF